MIRPESPSDDKLRKVWIKFDSVQPGELIELTHWEKGAWADRYEPGVKGITITHDNVVREAENRDEWYEITLS